MAHGNDRNVVKVDTYREISRSGSRSSGDAYKGLPVHARTGLHGFVADMVARYFPPGGTALDLGAGSGALAARLSDMGLNVTALDIVPGNFRLHGKVAFIQADLNEAFAERCGGTFDGITAVEIVEHLENPRKFLRECRKLLGDGGRMILSTPNVDNPVSKGMFLKSGTFQWFTDFHYEDGGHIMPVTQWLLKKIAAESGFSIEWLGTFGDPCGGLGPWRRAAAGLIRLLSRYRGELAGEILVAVLKKVEPPPDGG